MPILNVQIMEGHSAAQKAALLKAASNAVVESIAAPLPSVRIVLQEVPAEHVIVGGEIGKAMARVDVALISGRDEAKKAALIAALNEAVCGSIGISGQDVRVLLRDVPNTDMGAANGITAKANGR
ncbi:tautomerase family protein [Achromobacter insolitus]|uniref:4-oxalocrotonate tautomerase-like domain-containing protein n=1 Tax=Achromobacter insolitus TaxID=217204 RepID=A0A6S7FCM9_9BURK|nr:MULTISPECIES: tautomerase family protein [Achromobacter]GLK92301.1 4-oxalocrotonate tautomerase [Achromobacter xylosoxidans]APX75695.1 4-oxalocrotonate tautomerase [Achromobacter insolitus]AVG40606.1 4-oxalocrotonate tautomerase [Achromobacter insolitus]AXA71280.1 4-oxalocrotonate tautomerase [Achromobacter insolitus]MCP1402014.1 4-oxalocrotonate tautomerase family enzyme [Achromobacter insolitus]